MATIIYDGKAIIPAPFVTISKQYQKNSDGSIIGKIFNITVQGKLVAYKGSPNSNKVFHTSSGYPADENISDTQRLGSILRKQEAIRELFSTQGLKFEIQPLDGSASMWCNPRVNEITFQEGPWYVLCDYTINLEADEMYPVTEDNFTEYVQNSTETWSIEVDETAEDLNIPKTYKMSHTVSAVGKLHYNDDGSSTDSWKQARTYVQSRLGFDNTIMLSSGVLNLPSYYGGKNFLRSEQIDKTGGTYSVTESWVLASGNALEDFNLSVQSNLDNPYTTVSIDGNITGLEERDSNYQLVTSKYTNALSKYNLASGVAFSRAQLYSGLNLNVIPRASSRGINPVAGTISYSYEYDDRPSNNITGSKSELISINATSEVDVFAAIPVLGRSRGPVLQDISTKQQCERSVSIEVVFSKDYIPSGATISQMLNDYNPRLHSPQSTEIDSIISAASPVGHAFNNIGEVASTQYVSSKNENWAPRDRRYSLNMTWVYE